MRFFLWILALFASAIGIAVAAHYNVGNVVFFYPPYRIDLSLNFFILLAILLFAMIYAVLKTIRVTKAMPGRVAAYRRDKLEKKGNQALREALKYYFEGRFGHAEKAAMRASESPENAGLAALIAARAAHRMQQTDRRDTWLATLEEDASLKSARLMTAIELLIDERQPELALKVVDELNANGTRHIHALRMALKANQRAHNWPEVLRLVRTLDKNNALHPALSLRLRELAYDDLLRNPANDAESIRNVWFAIPAEDRVKPYVALRAAHAFNQRGLHDGARTIVEKAMAEEWDDRLLRPYRDAVAEQGTPALVAQIERCEEWHRKHPADPELELTLATLCLRQQLWGKAQRHLEQALSDAVTPRQQQESHRKLAQMYESLNQPEKAAAHYRQCALLVAA
ncbi:MAG: heme biosynthesis protein HemY [Oxalicibacterium faecigallinarum]|uniref:heme biosynthesis protein HemY n=1 Tax=Oxalicibacterium faecigallinarum TaxID=573741 RepID=UPI002808AD10|nr:heme biosynthesis protein HemY [Oxalicibacterium faecigallinarum]MDQ7970230.1 heme biosynthesis protein HemY [Oxalicibacterium faecigallinarum]